MTVEEVMENIESYDKPIQDAINLAVRTYSGEELELMLRAIVGE